MRSSGWNQNRICYEPLMTTNTISLQNFDIMLFDLNRFGVVIQSKGDRMIPTIARLRQPFADAAQRQMAVVTGRNMMMSGSAPGFILMIHHMAVRADLRIVGGVRKSLGVIEGESPETQQYPQSQGKRQQDRIALFYNHASKYHSRAPDTPDQNPPAALLSLAHLSRLRARARIPGQLSWNRFLLRHS